MCFLGKKKRGKSVFVLAQKCRELIAGQQGKKKKKKKEHTNGSIKNDKKKTDNDSDSAKNWEKIELPQTGGKGEGSTTTVIVGPDFPRKSGPKEGKSKVPEAVCCRYLVGGAETA